MNLKVAILCMLEVHSIEPYAAHNPRPTPVYSEITPIDLTHKFIPT